MKKLLIIAAAIFGVVILAVGGFAGFVAVSDGPTFDAPTLAPLTLAPTPKQVLRGQKIASMLCVECHADGQRRLVGARLPDLPDEFGDVYSANITQHKTAGIGAWRDEQLVYFLRTGIKPNGTYSPIMPKFGLMADADIQAVVAWLHSDDPAVAPATTPTTRNHYNFLVKALSRGPLGPVPAPTAPIVAPDSTDMVTFGRYVANGVATCYPCHSADFKTMNQQAPEQSGGFYGGGNPMLNRERQVIRTANLTFDAETGLADKYSEEQFVRAVRYGQKPDGSLLRYPMFPHAGLSEYEVRAIYAYLQTVPKLKNDVSAPKS